MTGAILRELFDLWRARNMSDEYIGTLVNAWLANGHEAWGIRAGEAYVDVGTLSGYRQAIRLLEDMAAREANRTAGGSLEAVA